MIILHYFTLFDFEKVFVSSMKWLDWPNSIPKFQRVPLKIWRSLFLQFGQTKFIYEKPKHKNKGHKWGARSVCKSCFKIDYSNINNNNTNHSINSNNNNSSNIKINILIILGGNATDNMYWNNLNFIIYVRV